jgi:hypothetical protein
VDRGGRGEANKGKARYKRGGREIFVAEEADYIVL